MTNAFIYFFQRPRKVGAKYTGMNIAPDEHVQPELMFDYDGKRDRWNGYNPEEHMKIVEEYAKVDLVRRHYSLLGKVQRLASLGGGVLATCTVNVGPCGVFIMESGVDSVFDSKLHLN